MTGSELSEKVKALTDEVNDLHPLLETIFRKMPSIRSVTNSQGPHEMGADFVLTKVSEELGDTEYVGVIVKIGKILQNHSEIDRQIEECRVGRITANGNKEIFLSEIWVAANGTISENARKKILQAHRTSNVKFLDLNKISDLTEQYVPEFFTGISMRVNKFLEEQSQEAIKREESTNLLAGVDSKVYIDQEIVEIDYEEYTNPKKFTKGKTVKIFDEIEKNRVLTIEAQMGGGKSKLLNNIVSHYSDRDVYMEKHVIPVYLHSSHLTSGKLEDLNSFIGKISKDYDFEKNEKDTYLLLIDGLDESNFQAESEPDFIGRLIEQTKERGDTKLIFATRRIGDEQLELKIQQFSKRFEIRPLTLNKVLKFILEICESLNVQNRLIEDLKKSALFKVLPRTPIAAIILAKILQESQEELPSNLTELYSQYIELSLGRWDIKKGLANHKEYEASVAILTRIAKYLMDNQLSALSFGEAMHEFEEYIEARNFDFNSSDLFSKVLDRCDILLKDPVTNSVSFRHRSFCEYFYAKSIQPSGMREISSGIFHPYWVNSFFFYVGLQKDCPELLTQIIELETRTEAERYAKMIGLGNLLLAGHLSPRSVIDRGVLTAFSEAASYYYDVSTGNIDSPLGVFPRVHLFLFFKFILSENYAYSFFGNSIVNAIEEVYTRKIRDDGDLYSLFFLDIARAELGHDEVFDELIDKAGKELPLILQVAVRNESRNMGVSSPSIKKLGKKYVKNVKRSREFSQAVKSLFEDTIDEKKRITRKGKRQVSKKSV